MRIPERSTLIERPVEDVFRFVSDPTNDPKWHPTVIKAEKTSDAPIGLGSTFTGIHDPHRQELATPPRPASFNRVTAEIVEFVPNERCRARVTFLDPLTGLGRFLGHDVTSIFRVEPASDGTRLFRSLELSPSFWLKPLLLVGAGVARRRNDRLLANIKAVLEA